MKVLHSVALMKLEHKTIKHTVSIKGNKIKENILMKKLLSINLKGGTGENRLYPWQYHRQIPYEGDKT